MQIGLLTLGELIEQLPIGYSLKKLTNAPNSDERWECGTETDYTAKGAVYKMLAKIKNLTKNSKQVEINFH